MGWKIVPINFSDLYEVKAENNLSTFSNNCYFRVPTGPFDCLRLVWLSVI